ncbi:MAG: hypothetical protein ACE5K3_10925 [bacterium]
MLKRHPPAKILKGGTHAKRDARSFWVSKTLSTVKKREQGFA